MGRFGDGIVGGLETVGLVKDVSVDGMKVGSRVISRVRLKKTSYIQEYVEL